MTRFALTHRTHPAVVGAEPHPALLLLHGRGADESDLLPLAGELDPRLFTVSARAPFRFPWGGYAWYHLDSNGVGFPEDGSLQRSLDLLRQLIDELIEAYPVDPRRLYVGGFSMGAAMAGSLALLQPERVSGAIVLSGYLPLRAGLPFRPQDAAGRPFFESHGTLDQVIPVSFARETREFLKGTPVALTYREYPIGHEISYQELRDLAAWTTEVLDRDETIPVDKTQEQEL